MLWPKYYGSKAIDENGELTHKAKIWQRELAGKTKEQIQTAYQVMGKKFATFPPTAMEFANLVSGDDFDSVLDEILDYINRSENDGFEWTSQLAFNVFHAMRYSKHEALSNEQLVMRARNAFKAVDRSSMFPIRNKEAKALPPPKTDDQHTIRKRHFHSLLMQALYRKDPELFISDKLEPLSERKLNSDPQRDLPPMMRKLFNPNNAISLMKKFAEVTGFSEKRPLQKDFESKSKWSKAFFAWKAKADTAMDKFASIKLEL